MDVFARYAEAYDLTKVEEMLLQDYLLGCRDDASMRATTAERMVAAIGEPELVDTSHDQRLGRIFLNRTIKRYKAFADLYGTE
jgi:serine protein kinase